MVTLALKSEDERIRLGAIKELLDRGLGSAGSADIEDGTQMVYPAHFHKWQAEQFEEYKKTLPDILQHIPLEPSK